MAEEENKGAQGLPTVEYQTPGRGTAMRGREAYNLVTDTVAGPNVRLKDNLLQGAVVLGCMVLCAFGGLIYAWHGERVMGVMVGGVAGMIVGVFSSGVFLMVYRWRRHAKGRHD